MTPKNQQSKGQIYEGRIVKAMSGFYYVKRKTDGVLYACRAKGIFRKKNYSPLVGDEVCFIVTHEGDKEGSIEEILARSSELTRPTVANVDLGLVVFALKDPMPNWRLLDRMLVILEQAGLCAVICFTKTDLVDEEEKQAHRDLYAKIGYPVILTSTKTGEGKEELLEALQGHLATMLGPSGAGKSSLVNWLCGEASMEVGEISDKIRRGKQTTRHVQLIELPLKEPSYLVDTPGFSSLDLGTMKREMLDDFFPEMHERSGGCRYASCSHLYEPEADCIVRQAVAAGEIAMDRYESYRVFYEEMKERY